MKHNKGLFSRRQDYILPKISYGKGVYVYDQNGNRYLDACAGAGVVNIGHGINSIGKVIGDYIGKLGYLHASQFSTKEIEEY